MNLPLPHRTTHPSDYQDTRVLNTLDGFNLQPRLSIPFDGPIDVTSVNSQDVFLINLGDTVDHQEHGNHTVGINQVVWDQATNTLHVESNDLLDQHTRYALIVTNGVHDASGHPVEATWAFRLAPLTLSLSHDPVLRNYGREMVQGLEAAYRAGVRVEDIVTASVFTTQSATAVLEKIRDQIHAATPAPADFLLGPGGTRTVFELSAVTGITFNQQRSVSGPLTPVDVTPTLSLSVIPGAVGQVAYGKYVSPDYEVHPGEYIPAVGTRTGTPAVQGYNEIYFTLYLPSGPEPEGGWPVEIVSHGGGDNKDSKLSGVQVGAATAAAKGIATIEINAVGHGYGPRGTLTVTQSNGSSVTLPAGGRGIDQNGDGLIGAAEGFSAGPPQEIISQRDGRIQTAADLMQLVRVVEAGVDVDGNGTTDLNPSRVYYSGASLGGWYGAPFLAVEPDVRAGVLNTVGGPELERRLGVNRAGTSAVRTMADILATRTPSLINSPGIIKLDGLSVPGPYFDENMPLRDGVPLTVGLEDGTTRVIQSPVTNTVKGAMAIQEFLDNWEWVSQPGNPVAYAPHLRKDPLPGVPAKSVIIQFAKGDQNIVNPTTTAFLRAGDLADRATFYRHDLAYADDGSRPRNPHTFLALIANPAAPTMKAIALGAQEQIAAFFASDGTEIIPPPGVEKYFEVPIKGPLPEGLNYIP